MSETSQPIDRKGKILRAAQETFGEYGYSRATIKMIAERAGVAFGLVSHYFGGKDNLFLAAGSDMVNTLLDVIRTGSKETESGLEAIRAFIQLYLGFTVKNHETFLILLHCSPFSVTKVDTDMSEIAEKFMDLIDEIEAYLKRGVADGSIRPLPTRLTAYTIYGAIVGAVRTKFLARYDVPDIFEETVAFTIRSIAADQSRFA